MGAQIGSPLELSFSPKLLKNGMGACLGTWAGDALRQDKGPVGPCVACHS